MGRKPFKSPEEKLQVVLSVLRGEVTQVAVARQLEMSQTTIAKWQKQFLEGGLEALARGDNPRPPTDRHEVELEAQVEELTKALGEVLIYGTFTTRPEADDLLAFLTNPNPASVTTP